MMHKNRRFQVVDVSDAAELAETLIAMTWCGCNGFRFAGHLLLNDSTSADGAQEYAVVREASMIQVESITFGWCDEAETLSYLSRIAAGEFTCSYGPVTNVIEIPDAHGRCGHCA